MTTVYFIRHAEPNYSNHDDMSRELSDKGLRDRALVTEFLRDKHIHAVLSSPYKRAVDTISDFARSANLEVQTVADFRERKVGGEWIADFHAFCKKQWENFDYKLPGGEALNEVQRRNIRALNAALNIFNGKNIVIGSHGTALSTVINYYDPSFGYSHFEKIKNLMPWAVKFVFEDTVCSEIQPYDLFGLCGPAAPK